MCSMAILCRTVRFTGIAIIFLVIFGSVVHAYPIQIGDQEVEDLTRGNRTVPDAKDVWTAIATAAAVLTLLSAIYILGCACCRFRPRLFGFKKFRDDNVLVHEQEAGFEHDGVGSAGEVHLVPAQLESIAANKPLPVPTALSSVVEGRPADSYIPAALATWSINGCEKDWFDDPHGNFPRNQLKYVELLGKGWFGQAILTEAWGRGISFERQKRAVVVKSLTEGASPAEQMCFLHEVRAFRDVNHPNVLRLVGRCLEADPFLVILEYYSMGDLKAYLRSQRGTPGEEGLKRDGVLLRMAQEVAGALSAMHHQGIVHLDLAARNCLVADDLRIKVGDYGCAMQKYPEDYLLTDNGAVPIRWVAPECVRPALSSVEIKELTTEANIWAYGVVLWEILEMGARPYGELVVDSDVIKRVIVERNYRLRVPTGSCPYKDRLYQVMHMCWQEEQLRPTMTVVTNLMNHLLHACDSYSSPDDVGADFEIRWHALQQSNKPAVLNLDSSYDLHPSLCFESDFNLTAMKDQMLGGRSQGSFLADVQEEEHFSPGGAFALGPQEERRISSGEEDFKRWLDGETSVMNVNFKIGKDDQSIVSRVPFSPQSMSASLLDGTLESLRLPSAPNSHNNANSNDTDTDDDVAWKFKLENEYLTKKVREKSKSVQDLMKLTHLDSSPDPDSSDSDSPPVKSGSNLNSLTNFCASESDIRGAVVEKAFLEDLEKLQAERHVQLASTVKPEEDPRRKEQCRPVSTSTPRSQYPALETISADLAKFRPEVYDLDASDVIMGPCDDLGLNCFQALKSASIIGGKPSATVLTMTSAAKRSLFTQHQDSSTTSGYGSCHDADSGKETTPDAPDVVFWSNNTEKGDKTDDSADNNCGSSVSSQDSGVGDKMRAPKAMTMAPVSQSMDSVLDLFTDLEEAAGVSESQEKGLSPKGRKKRKKHSNRWSTESSGSYVVVKTPPKDLDDTVDEADEASTSTNDEDELEVSTKKRRSKRWSTETTGSIVVINTPEKDEDVCNLSRISEEFDASSNRWSTETADSVVVVNTPVRTVPTASNSANTSKMSEGSSASTLYVTAREDLPNESYATIVAIEDEATLTPGQFNSGLHGSEDAVENYLKVEDLFNTSISPIDSQPSSFGPLDYLSAEGRGSIDEERTPVSTRSEPGFGDELLSHLGTRRASEPVGFSFGDPIDDEQDDEDRENKTESLKDLRAMLCLTLGGGDPQSESVDPAKLEEPAEEAEEVENVVINHCSGSGTGSGSLSSSLPLVLSPIHELSETEEGEESNSSEEESSDESEVEREDLQKPNFLIPTINHGAIVVEDLDSPDRFDSIRTLENQHSSFIEGFMGDEDEDDEFSDRDDILVVDTETNQAFLCNGAKPKAQLAFVCQERPLLEPEELEVYGQNDEEDPESLPVFDVGGKVGSSSKYFGGPRALQYPRGGMLHSLPPVGFGDNDEDEVWLKHGRESGLLQPMSLPWGGEKPEEQFLYQEDPWTRDRAVASMSSLRNATGSVSNEDSPARSVGNEEDRNSSVFSSPRDIPLPDESDRCRENAEEQGGEIEPQWSQLVEEAENSEQINFNTLTDLGPSLNDDDVADLPCLTYTDADIDGEDAVGDLVDTADGRPEVSELGACAAVAGSEVEGVRYTPDFESESTEGSEESDDDDASTTSGEYVYTRSPVEQKPVEQNVNDKEPQVTDDASAMAGRLMALNPKERPMEGDEGSDAENGDHGCDYEDDEKPQANGQYPFQPSIWNRELAPSRSLLKTPDKPPTPDAKKSVTFKKPKCSKIYEYPGPEPESHLKNAYRGFAISDDYTHKLWSLSSNSRPVNVAEWDAADDDDIPEELTSGPSTWPSVGAAFHVDDEEIYPTPSRLSTMNYFSFRPERTEGDGGFSGSEFFPGRYTSVEFFDENQTSPEKPGPTKGQPSTVHNNFRAEGEPCSLPNTSDLHSMWRKEGRLPDRSDLRLELRPAPLGAESCEPPADAKPSEADKDIGGGSDEGICDTGIAKGEALAME